MPDPVAWPTEAVPQGWRPALAALRERDVLDSFYLAGGTGLALQLGHRLSVDLDLFTEQDFPSGRLRDRLRGIPGLGNVQLAPGSLSIEINEVKASFLHYPYPRLFPSRRFEGLEVADLRDIACMKLDAVANRGSRRDFVDLYAVAQRHALGQMLDWFSAKYAAVSPNRVHLLKALTYFADAEQEPMPNMLMPLRWADVTAFFEREAPRLV